MSTVAGLSPTGDIFAARKLGHLSTHKDAADKRKSGTPPPEETTWAMPLLASSCLGRRYRETGDVIMEASPTLQCGEASLNRFQKHFGPNLKP